MSVKLIKTFTGNYQVAYACPNCSESLRNPIRDVGNEDSCPACKHRFRVPNSPEIQVMQGKLADETERKAEAERIKAEEKQREIEAAQLKKRIGTNQAAIKNEAPQTHTWTPSVSAPAISGARPTTRSEDFNDLVSWAVRTTRRLLNLSLLIWWTLCAANLFGSIVVISVLYRNVATSRGDSVGGVENVVAYVFALALSLAFWLLMAFAGTVSVGVAGVLFEIEKNTRK